MQTKLLIDLAEPGPSSSTGSEFAGRFREAPPSLSSRISLFVALRLPHQLVVTATSGTAAAGIGGTTIHSALGLSFKDVDGRIVAPGANANEERLRQRWLRRKVLVIDEASMLGLATLYEIDQKLRSLRAQPDCPFGGLPVIVLVSDFLQFGPVLPKSLLSHGPQVQPRADNTTTKLWQESEARRLWQAFNHVVMLEEQKRASADDFLQGFLERLRSGTQTPDDASKLAARFTPGTKFDFSLGTRAIITLNRHRWDITLHAMLDYSNATGKRLSIFLSDHQWKSRVPSTTERTAAVLLGDEGKLPVPGMFPFVEGMPVLVNVNKYMGLKVVNGSEYEAAGIILEPGVEEVVLSDHLSLFLGPPAGILLRSADTQHLSIPHIPEGTVLLPATTVTLEDKHAKILCPELAGHKDFKLDITRTGLPCTPGVALTDFKAQGRSIDHPLLGLYGRGKGRGRGSALDKCDAISVYVQVSRATSWGGLRLMQPLDVKNFLSLRMPSDLVQGIDRLRSLAAQTVANYSTRHSLRAPPALAQGANGLEGNAAQGVLDNDAHQGY
ncbi:DNA repair and recombination protein [Colletotrichum musicola]|uniref:ATP-dependent DNA helicase n=1 Tax=Colletotrichum musicola TaxID=2175873 RepID=A0A8H6MLG7_9PEZI|nr:DNA repair and recombination protein [Colletotrichum musicola]